MENEKVIESILPFAKYNLWQEYVSSIRVKEDIHSEEKIRSFLEDRLDITDGGYARLVYFNNEAESTEYIEDALELYNDTHEDKASDSIMSKEDTYNINRERISSVVTILEKVHSYQLDRFNENQAFIATALVFKELNEVNSIGRIKDLSKAKPEEVLQKLSGDSYRLNDNGKIKPAKRQNKDQGYLEEAEKAGKAINKSYYADLSGEAQLEEAPVRIGKSQNIRV
jgi:hypothetical protein